MSFRYSLLWILGFAALGCNHPSGWRIEGDDAVVDVPWKCAQTQKTSVPTQKDITVRIPYAKFMQHHAVGNLEEAKKLLVDTPEFNEIYEKSRTSPDYDFSVCASNFVAEVRQRASEACEEFSVELTEGRLKDSGLQYIVENCGFYADVMLQKLVETEAKFYAKAGRKPAFAPNGESNLSKSTLDEMENDMRQFCGEELSSDLSYLDRDFLDRLPNIGSKVSGECKEGIYGTYLDLLDQSRMAFCKMKFFPLEPKTGSLGLAAPGVAEKNQEDCLKYLSGELVVLEKLKAADLLPEELKDQFEFYKGMACLSLENQKYLFASDHPLIGLQAVLQNIASCTPLEVGEEMLVDETVKGALTPHYVLKKTANNEFTAVVDIDFENPDHKKTATDCLAKADGHLNGPGGKTLKIRLAADFKTKNTPKTREVGSSDAGERANASVWPEDISCGTVVHEVLHLLGLVDEYKEKSIGYVYDEDEDTWKYVREDGEAISYNCRYPEFSGGYAMKSSSTTWEQVVENPSPALGYGGLVGNSLIGAEQFGVITEPGCSLKNKRYYLCGSQANRTFYKNIQGETLSAGRCNPRAKRECTSDQQLRNMDGFLGGGGSGGIPPLPPGGSTPY